MSRFITRFQRWHYDWLGAAGAGPVGPIDGMTLAQIERENSWTAVVDGAPVVCAGTLKHWEGRHMAWAYLARESGPHMLWITREVKQRLAAVSGRIEMTVLASFLAGHRWARLLGFEIETPLMRRYGPDRADHVGYVRFN